MSMIIGGLDYKRKEIKSNLISFFIVSMSIMGGKNYRVLKR